MQRIGIVIVDSPSKLSICIAQIFDLRQVGATFRQRVVVEVSTTDL
jgi:hypothetical protein